MKHLSLVMFFALIPVTFAATPIKEKAKVGMTSITSVTPAPTPLPAIQDRTAKYYDVGKTDQPPVYTQVKHFEKMPNGDMTERSSFTDGKGEVIATDLSVYQGSRMISEVFDEIQVKKHLEATVKDDRVYFHNKQIMADGKEEIRDASDGIPKNFVTLPISENFLIGHLDEIMAGDTVHCNFGVLELHDIIGFKFWLKSKDTETVNGHEAVVVSMKPSSIFLAFLVSTINLSIDPKEKKLVKFVGRTALWKKGADDVLQPYDSEVIYQ